MSEHKSSWTFNFLLFNAEGRLWVKKREWLTLQAGKIRNRLCRMYPSPQSCLPLSCDYKKFVSRKAGMCCSFRTVHARRQQNFISRLSPSMWKFPPLTSWGSFLHSKQQNHSRHNGIQNIEWIPSQNKAPFQPQQQIFAADLMFSPRSPVMGCQLDCLFLRWKHPSDWWWT